MAYIDKLELLDYPFEGEFYRTVTNTSLPLTQQKPEEELICKVVCDIQEGSNYRQSTTSKAVYEVYVPFDSETDEIPVKRGDWFRGTQYGLRINGQVFGVFGSQVGTFENYTDRGSDVVPHQCRGYLARVEAVDV